MISGFTNIKKEFSQNQNFWDLNPHMIYVAPFADLYTRDKSKDKEQSSKDMWCIFWLSDPDEEINKYYRLPKDQLLDTCKSFNPNFDPTDPDIEDCLNRYPYLCLSADELAYKQQKDQLIEISRFLATQEISFDNIETLIKLKSQLPKIYQDFDKVEKNFVKVKQQSRVHGGRTLNQREKGNIIPEE